MKCCKFEPSRDLFDLGRKIVVICVWVYECTGALGSDSVSNRHIETPVFPFIIQMTFCVSVSLSPSLLFTNSTLAVVLCFVRSSLCNQM